MRAFEAAARLKSFSKAAAELNVTPAAISHQIHALEADLGVRLFDRRSRAVELTASARLLLPGLTDAFAGIQASVRRLRAHNDTGTLTVTASPSIAAKWLVLRLHRFQEQHPAIDVRISATDNMVDLTRGDFDLGDPLRHRPLSRAACRTAAAERGVSGVQPAPAGNRAAAAHARRSAAPRADPLDQATDRYPLVPTWPMWLKAAGVGDIPTTSGLTFSIGYMAMDAAIAGHGVVLAYSTIAAADSPPGAWCGSSRWRCPTCSPITS